MNLLSIFQKKTKWRIFATYNSSGNDYIVFVRKNTKTGMLYFKSKNISPIGKTSYLFMGNSIFDVKEVFDKIVKEDKI
jgi:hypothetical protein